MNVHNGEILGLGSFPTFDPSLFTRPLTQKQVDETYNNPTGAAHRPGDRRPLPDRLDLQAAHRHGGAGKRHPHALALDLRRRCPHGRHPELQKRRRRLLRQPQPGSGLGSLRRRLLLHARPRNVEHGPAAALGARAGYRAAERDRPARGRRRPAADETVARQACRRRPGRRTSLVLRRQHPARHRAGRPADQPAADGDRLRDPGQRRHCRYPARRQGSDRPGRTGAEGIRPAPAPPRQDQAGIRVRRFSKASTTPRRTPVEPPTPSSATSRCRSRARPAPRSA